MRGPQDPEGESPPGGHAADRLREQLRDRFGDDPAQWPDTARQQLEAMEQDPAPAPPPPDDGA
jgi:hypothetical protein